jgi:hypothetical protein
MRIQVDYDKNMNVASITDLDTGFNAVYDATSDTNLINAFQMFIKDSKEHCCTDFINQPVYGLSGNVEYYQLTMKEAI